MRQWGGATRGSSKLFTWRQGCPCILIHARRLKRFRTAFKANGKRQIRVYVIFKKTNKSVLSGSKSPSGFTSGKTRAASSLNGFKNIPGKACVNRPFA